MARRGDLVSVIGDVLTDLKKSALRSFKVSEVEGFSRSLRGALHMDKVAAERVGDIPNGQCY